MFREGLVVLSVVFLTGCLSGGGAPKEVVAFVDGAGQMVAAVEPCDPVLAARAAACARRTVATWPEPLSDDARVAALERLETVRTHPTSAACAPAAATLQSQKFWARCYSAVN